MPPRSDKPKTPPKRRPAAKLPHADAIEKAWKLRRECQSTAKIAHVLNAGEQAVAAVLRQLEEHLLAELMAETTAVKARQTAQLERVAEEAFSAWFQSRKKVGTTRTRTKTGPGSNGATEIKEQIKERTMRSQAGTPSFLVEVRAALADIRKLWGLDGKSVASANPDAIDPEVAEAAIAAALAAARKKKLLEP